MVESLAKQGWSVRDDFLSQRELMAINQAFANWENHFTQAKIGQHLEHKEIRGDRTWWFDLAAPPQELRAVLQRIEDYRVEINRSLFLGLKDWEVHLATYAPGAFYKKHLDRHQTNSARKLSLILYLNLDWEPSHGGELVMYDKSGIELQRIQPIGGRLVSFLSEDFPHEVLPATRERRSLTGWFLDQSRGIV
jgi:SM-20-related protein